MLYYTHLIWAHTVVISRHLNTETLSLMMVGLVCTIVYINSGTNADTNLVSLFDTSDVYRKKWLFFVYRAERVQSDHTFFLYFQTNFRFGDNFSDVSGLRLRKKTCSCVWNKMCVPNFYEISNIFDNFIEIVEYFRRYLTNETKFSLILSGCKQYCM